LRRAYLARGLRGRGSARKCGATPQRLATISAASHGLPAAWGAGSRRDRALASDVFGCSLSGVGAGRQRAPLLPAGRPVSCERSERAVSCSAESVNGVASVLCVLCCVVPGSCSLLSPKRPKEWTACSMTDTNFGPTKPPSLGGTVHCKPCSRVSTTLFFFSFIFIMYFRLGVARNSVPPKS